MDWENLFEYQVIFSELTRVDYFVMVSHYALLILLPVIDGFDSFLFDEIELLISALNLFSFFKLGFYQDSE